MTVCCDDLKTLFQGQTVELPIRLSFVSGAYFDLRLLGDDPDDDIEVTFSGVTGVVTAVWSDSEIDITDAAAGLILAKVSATESANLHPGKKQDVQVKITLADKIYIGMIRQKLTVEEQLS